MEGTMKFMDKPNVPPPDGYKVVYEGDIEHDDYIWDRVAKRWALVFGHITIIAGKPVPDNGTVAKSL
jgi:hypothetical protein